MVRLRVTPSRLFKDGCDEQNAEGEKLERRNRLLNLFAFFADFAWLLIGTFQLFNLGNNVEGHLVLKHE